MLAKEGFRTAGEDGRQLDVVAEAFNAALEALLMRAQYVHDITKHRVEEARQMAFLLEQRQDAVL